MPRSKDSAPYRATHRARRGFTLIELCVVIAILTVLLALALPAIQRVRATVDQVRCRNNLHQIGVGLHAYHSEHFRLPVHGGGGNPSWTVQLLPHIEQANLFRQLDHQFDWRHPKNGQSVLAPVRLFQCPLGDREREVQGSLNGVPWKAAGGDYVTFLSVTSFPGLPPQGDRAGAMSANRLGKGRAWEDFVDGMAATMLVGEAVGTHAWPDAAIPVAPSGGPAIGPGGLFSPHRNGAHLLMADGAVLFLGEHVTAQTLSALITFAGRDMVDLADLD